MSIVRYIQKLQMLDALIRRKSTGNQKEFCRKACISRSLLNNYINEMKQLGFPIEYDKNRKTYYYSEDGMLVSHLFQRKMDKVELDKIDGGGIVIHPYGTPFLGNEFPIPNSIEFFNNSSLCWLDNVIQG